jgi:hypothetical protein
MSVTNGPVVVGPEDDTDYHEAVGVRTGKET